MPMPTALVCIKCGNIFGAVIHPPAGEKLAGLRAACQPCISSTAAQTGAKLDSDESWDTVIIAMESETSGREAPIGRGAIGGGPIGPKPK